MLGASWNKSVQFLQLKREDFIVLQMQDKRLIILTEVSDKSIQVSVVMHLLHKGMSHFMRAKALNGFVPNNLLSS